MVSGMKMGPRIKEPTNGTGKHGVTRLHFDKQEEEEKERVGTWDQPGKFRTCVSSC